MSYVYFLTDADRDDAIIKIGVSHDVARRIKQLEMQVPFKIKCIQYIEARNQYEAYKIEHAFHRHFEDRRVMREWFDIRHDEIIPAAAAIGELLDLGVPNVFGEVGDIPPRIDRG